MLNMVEVEKEIKCGKCFGEIINGRSEFEVIEIYESFYALPYEKPGELIMELEKPDYGWWD